MYFVLYKDDFGEKKIASFETYADVLEFYKRPSNVYGITAQAKGMNR